MLHALKNDLRWVAILALAIAGAIVIWKVVAFVTAIVASLIMVGVVLAVLYVVFLMARSRLRHRRRVA